VCIDGSIPFVWPEFIDLSISINFVFYLPCGPNGAGSDKTFDLPCGPNGAGSDKTLLLFC